jgi:hypothetical protein
LLPTGGPAHENTTKNKLSKRDRSWDVCAHNVVMPTGQDLLLDGILYH